MYVIISKVSPAGRGYTRLDNHRVTVVKNIDLTNEEEALQKELNDLANEGARGDSHEIIQVMWRPDPLQPTWTSPHD